MNTKTYNRKVEKTLERKFSESEAIHFYIATVKELRTEKGILLSDIAELKDKIHALQGDIIHYQDTATSLVYKLAASEHKLSKVEEELKHYQRSLDFTAEVYNEICTADFPQISKKQFNILRDHLARFYNSKIKNCNIQNQTIASKAKKEKVRNDYLEKERTKFQAEIIDLKNKLSKYEQNNSIG